MNKYLVIVTKSLLLSMIFVSCSKDSDTPSNTVVPEKVEKTIENAGEFIITNLSSKENIDGSEAKMINDDTLKVVFKPKNEYKNISFPISCTLLKKINDSIFVVSQMSPKNYDLLFKAASNKVEKKDSSFTYTAERKLSVTIPSSYAIIPFHLEVAPDLLQLTTVEVTYKNGDGTQGKYVINNDWISRDSTSLYIFTNAEGQKLYTGDINPEGEWTLVEERKYPSNSFADFNVRYYLLGVENEVIVNYIPKDILTLDRDIYILYHSLDRQSATIVVPGTTITDIYSASNISINIGSSYGVKKNDVQSYLDNLRNTPDVFKFNISNKGSITRINQ